MVHLCLGACAAIEKYLAFLNIFYSKRQHVLPECTVMNLYKLELGTPTRGATAIVNNVAKNTTTSSTTVTLSVLLQPTYCAAIRISFHLLSFPIMTALAS